MAEQHLAASQVSRLAVDKQAEASEPPAIGVRTSPTTGAPSPKWASNRYQVFIHLDRNLFGQPDSWEAFLDDGTALSAETFRRVSCDGGLVGTSGGAGEISVGRRTRAIPPAIRRALWLRDRGCRFPGCGNRRFVHGHHIRHWVDGGPTSTGNLVLLCSFHHRLLHEGGFSMTTDKEDGELHFFDQRHRPVPATPSCRATVTDDPREILSLSAAAGDDYLPHDPTVNTCRWEGEPIDYDEVVDEVLSRSPSLERSRGPAT